ncbi:MAG TPA: hypothetical protein VFT04_13030 [Gemmatimonadales bacterium]|nr:hypothetical protein [Gemmatimonadales bacterium]
MATKSWWTSTSEPVAALRVALRHFAAILALPFVAAVVIPALLSRRHGELPGSSRIALWAAAVIMINHVYFIAIEEPGLERRFGESYRRYAATVPRWLPRLGRFPRFP